MAKKSKAPVKRKSTAKSKSPSKKDNLQMYRDFAQYVTVISAVMFGIIWAIQEAVDVDITKLTSLGNMLIVTTMIGGVTMGLLYLVHQTKN